MEPISRDFSMSLADLAMFSGDVVVFLRRDAAEVLERGVAAADVDAFEVQINAFEIFPTDQYYAAEIMVATEEKNAKRELAFGKIQLISGFFEQKWGLDSGRYKQLGIKDLSKMKENDFVMNGRGVVKVATDQLANLSAEGLVQSDIDDLSTALEEMEVLIHGIKDRIAIRDIKTNERMELANALYASLKKFTTVGKLVWENINEAKYNDYIIYKTVHHTLPKPQNLVVSVGGPGQNLATLTWSSVVDATEYEVYASQVPIGLPEGEFTLINTVVLPTDEQLLTINFNYYFKIRAKNANLTSAFSDIVFATAS